MKRLICLLSIAVIFCIPVSAEEHLPSPTGTKIYAIKFYNGDYNALPYSIEVGQTFKANIDMTKGNWDKWTFFRLDGSNAVKGTDYKLINCTVLSSSIEIEPHTDLIICANYDELIVPSQPKKSKKVLKSSNDTDNDDIKDDIKKDNFTLSYQSSQKVCLVLFSITGVLFGMLCSHFIMCWVLDKSD